MTNSPEKISLLDLNLKIKQLLKSGMGNSLWIFGEICEIKVNYSGHCYLELIQKDENSDQIVARCRATIWGQTYRFLKPYFETTTGQSFSQGLRILVKVTIEFHEVFGLSLNIIDIEPTYTVGELAIRKQKIIDQLTREGVIGMNRETVLPQLCRKIAIISSETAAGYGDFIDQLRNNAAGFTFYCKLFPAAMQGDDVERSVIRALDKIYRYEDFFDVVVIIRGGGSQADLNCFNNYLIACHIAQFPLPVLTGIGHEQDDTIADLVAHTRLKTPTAVAEFLIGRMELAEAGLFELAEKISEEAQLFIGYMKDDLVQSIRSIQMYLKDSLNEIRLDLNEKGHLLINSVGKKNNILKGRLNASSLILKMELRKYMEYQLRTLETFSSKLRKEATAALALKGKDLDAGTDKLRVLDPRNILRRGFSITRVNGMVLKDTDAINEGDQVSTILSKGEIESIINKINP